MHFLNCMWSKMKDSADRGQQMVFISDQCFTREGCFLVWAVEFLVLESRVWSLQTLALGNTKAQLLPFWERYHSEGFPKQTESAKSYPTSSKLTNQASSLISLAERGKEQNPGVVVTVHLHGPEPPRAGQGWTVVCVCVCEARIAEGVREPLELAPEWGIIEEWILADI